MLSPPSSAHTFLTHRSVFYFALFFTLNVAIKIALSGSRERRTMATIVWCGPRFMCISHNEGYYDATDEIRVARHSARVWVRKWVMTSSSCAPYDQPAWRAHSHTHTHLHRHHTEFPFSPGAAGHCANMYICNCHKNDADAVAHRRSCFSINTKLFGEKLKYQLATFCNHVSPRGAPAPKIR